MIGYKKRIIIVSMGFTDLIMQNPVIKAKSGKYETEESCLSLTGRRKTERYQNIEVEYFDISFKKQKQKFSGFINTNIVTSVPVLNQYTHPVPLSDHSITISISLKTITSS